MTKRPTITIAKKATTNEMADSMAVAYGIPISPRNVPIAPVESVWRGYSNIN
jgi:hypothetical protein